MDFYKNLKRDERSRFYLPVQRIVCENKTQNSDSLINNEETQYFLHYAPKSLIIELGGEIIVDFGRAIAGGVRINSGNFGDMELSFGESVSETLGESNQDHSRTRAKLELPKMGTVDYGNTVFRFVRIVNIGTTELKLSNVLAVVCEHDITLRGSFESSDARLNQIWNTAIRTVHLCMQEYIYDGAKRDRLVWMGDLHPEIHGLLVALGNHKIIRNSLEFVIKNTPVNAAINTLSSYNCWFVICSWDYYWATNDEDYLRKNADYLEATINTFSQYVDEMGREILPAPRFLDWKNEANPASTHAGLQALLAWMMQTGVKILNLLGRNSSLAQTSYNKLCSYVPDCQNRKSPAALLHLMKIADMSKVIANNPYDDISTFYGYYVLQTKDTISALDLIRNYWGGMLDFGATSFWEDFDLNWIKNASRIDELPIKGKTDLHADCGDFCYKSLRHSLSHGWSCGPAPFMSQRILGVNFLEAGGKRVSIKPDLGDLEYVKGVYPTNYGDIKIEADRSGKINIDAPMSINIDNN